MSSGICDSYWNQTETFEALRMYIDMNFEGLKDDVLSMIAGGWVQVETRSFTNDMTTFHSKDGKDRWTTWGSILIQKIKNFSRPLILKFMWIRQD